MARSANVALAAFADSNNTQTGTEELYKARASHYQGNPIQLILLARTLFSFFVITLAHRHSVFFAEGDVRVRYTGDVDPLFSMFRAVRGALILV